MGGVIPNFLDHLLKFNILARGFCLTVNLNVSLNLTILETFYDIMKVSYEEMFLR